MHDADVRRLSPFSQKGFPREPVQEPSACLLSAKPSNQRPAFDRFESGVVGKADKVLCKCAGIGSVELKRYVLSLYLVTFYFYRKTVETGDHSLVCSRKMELARCNGYLESRTARAGSTTSSSANSSDYDDVDFSYERQGSALNLGPTRLYGDSKCCLNLMENPRCRIFRGYESDNSVYALTFSQCKSIVSCSRCINDF